MIIPRDSAYQTINLLGHEQALHLTDSADPANRSFSSLVKRCEEGLQKCEMMAAAIKKEGIEVEEYEEKDSGFVDNLRKGWREETKLLGIEEAKLIDVYEERVTDQYARFQDLADRLERLESGLKRNL